MEINIYSVLPPPPPSHPLTFSPSHPGCPHLCTSELETRGLIFGEIHSRASVCAGAGGREPRDQWADTIVIGFLVGLVPGTAEAEGGYWSAERGNDTQKWM